MAIVAIVYHSGFGHTKVLAEAVQRGAARVDGTDARLIPVDELPGAVKGQPLGGRWNELAQADAIVFGSPTYMGSITAEFKKFMETSSGPWFAQAWKDKLAAGFTNSGSLSGDKLNTLLDMAVFAGQHSMIWVNPGILPSSMTNDGQDLNRIGSWIGVMAQSENAAPEVTPPPGDRRTAELLGQRVAEVARRWLRGK